MLFPLGSVEARLLLLEDPLRSFPERQVGHRRLEMSSEFFGAGWTGMRQTFRIDGTRNERVGWSISLPWLYSSYQHPGESGRDNLRAGGSIRLSGDAKGYLGLLTEGWLPFSNDALYPLQQRRSFARLALIGASDLRSFRLRGGVAYRWELKGIGPDTFDAGWPNRYLAFFELGRDIGEQFEARCEGGISVSDEAATWSRLGVALAVDWTELWRAELSFETTLGNQSDRDLHDYRVGFRILRSFIPPPDATAIEGIPLEEGVPAGETPPINDGDN